MPQPEAAARSGSRYARAARVPVSPVRAVRRCDRGQGARACRPGRRRDARRRRRRSTIGAAGAATGAPYGAGCRVRCRVRRGGVRGRRGLGLGNGAPYGAAVHRSPVPPGLRMPPPCPVGAPTVRHSLRAPRTSVCGRAIRSRGAVGRGCLYRRAVWLRRRAVGLGRRGLHRTAAFRRGRRVHRRPVGGPRRAAAARHHTRRPAHRRLRRTVRLRDTRLAAKAVIGAGANPPPCAAPPAMCAGAPIQGPEPPTPDVPAGSSAARAGGRVR